jgi:Fe-S-cluster-containing dehydrogenase component
MKKWMMIVDVAKCNNCQNCVVAVKDEYVGNDFPNYSVAQPRSGHEWISVDRHVRGNGSMVDVTYVPRMCNHCDDAPCIAAGRGAIAKREDGIVLIDPVKSKGRRDLVDACPYGAIWWNEELQVPQHWTFDAHLIDGGWKQPRCVQACPSGALRSEQVSDAEAAEIVTREKLRVMRPELATRPRVHYAGLDAVQTCFIGGNAASRSASGSLDNLAGAAVTLSIEGEHGDVQTLHATTNAFGDFKIDGLPPSARRYSLSIKHDKHGVAQVSDAYTGSAYLGSFELR